MSGLRDVLNFDSQDTKLTKEMEIIYFLEQRFDAFGISAQISMLVSHYTEHWEVFQILNKNVTKQPDTRKILKQYLVSISVLGSALVFYSENPAHCLYLFY